MELESETGASRPSPEQTLLLRAALLEREPALAAWTAWKARAPRIEDLDRASQRLLPQLYVNLTRLAVADPLLDRMRTRYMVTRARNDRLLARTGDVLRDLETNGIPTLVLKGAVLALYHYRNLGARPMLDVDVLVPRERALDAIAFLEARGWRSRLERGARAQVPYRHATSFDAPDGAQLDLHWYLVGECSDAAADRRLWAAAEAAEIGGARTRRLCATDQLLHVCVHGASRALRAATIRWIADALMVLRTDAATLDWERLAREAEARQLGFVMRETIEYLATAFDAPVPPAARARLHAVRTSAFERWEHRAKQRARRERLLGNLPLIWAHFRRLRAGDGAIGFLDYLRYRWDLADAREVPRYLLASALRRAVGVPARRLARLAARVDDRRAAPKASASLSHHERAGDPRS